MLQPTRFIKRRHVVTGQYLREYPRGSADASVDSLLEAVQYVPAQNPIANKGDMTVIVCGGVGIPKEAYEPLFADLTQKCLEAGQKVRGFWIADPVDVGGSAGLNRGNRGNDPHWFDHSRDMLQVVNEFRKEMPEPIIGLGHSMGAAQIVHLSHMHPRLFMSLILIEPAIWTQDIATFFNGTIRQIRALRSSRNFWKSREEAEATTRGRAFKAWDPRALELFREYGFHEVNRSLDHTDIHSDMDVSDVIITKSVSPDTEMTYLARPKVATSVEDEALPTPEQHAAMPDLYPTIPSRSNWYKSEPAAAQDMLPSLRPTVLFVRGDKSHLFERKLATKHYEMTGTGTGGSGGATVGAVQEIVIQGGSHVLIMTQPHLQLAVDGISSFVMKQHGSWDQTQRQVQKGLERAFARGEDEK